MGLVMATLPLAVPARVGPLLAGDRNRTECRVALEMAKAAFNSTNPDLYWPIPTPDPAKAGIVFSRTMNADNGVQADPAIFDSIRLTANPDWQPTVYWQRAATNGTHSVVVAAPFNWRGDWYYLFRVDAGLTLDDFLRLYSQVPVHDAQRTAADTSTLIPVLGDNRWQPPILLQTRQTGVLWALDQGEADTPLPPWKVTLMEADGTTSPCQVGFIRPTGAGLAVLPAAVRRFARLADEALGPGRNEGTLHPTANIRMDVERDWAILSERPWALTAAPYNSRREVDPGLSKWSKAVPARGRLRRKLSRSYNPAKEALAKFLASRFAIQADEARSFSAYAMDVLLRNYFVFHRDAAGASSSTETPWPRGKR